MVAQRRSRVEATVERLSHVSPFPTVWHEAQRPTKAEPEGRKRQTSVERLQHQARPSITSYLVPERKVCDTKHVNTCPQRRCT